MIFGITGGTGCGKTTLLNVIRDCGGLVLDCDEIYHELLESDRDMLEAIHERFPDAFFEGKLIIKQLGAIVFADPEALTDLNRITHRAVKAEVLRRLAHREGLAAIDAIALIESGLAELCDLTVAVTAPLEDRVVRLMARDGISEDYARKRIAAQHDAEWFRQHCDRVLTNDADCPAFTRKCIAFLAEFGIIVNGNPNC